MDKIKATSKADVKRKIKELEDIRSSLELLLRLHSTLSGTINLTFSKDCKECLNQAEFIRQTCDLFKSSTANLAALYNGVNALIIGITPTAVDPHFEDYVNGEKPPFDENYKPFN